jgi:hypothetical protein
MSRPLRLAVASVLTNVFTSVGKSQTYITFDPPGAINTQSACHKGLGVVIGSYVDPSTLIRYGFLRSPQETFTQINAPSAVGTIRLSINDSGAIAGWYCDRFSLLHGLVRTPQGAYADDDPRLSAQTRAVSISGNGAITGFYDDGITYFCHGFLRDPTRAYTVFDRPEARTGSYVVTGQL